MDREAIRRAADELDIQLASSPKLLGESRGSTVRIAFSFPLAIEYEVIESEHKVLVLAVWAFRAT